MKEKAIEKDLQRGYELLYRLFRLFPFKLSVNEDSVNRYRKLGIHYMINRFWIGVVFDELDKQGYMIPFESYELTHLKEDLSILTEKIFNYLSKIEKNPKKDIYLMNREFLSLRLFFKILHKSLYYKDKGGWKELIKVENDDILKEFYLLFGYIYSEVVEYIFSPEEFCNCINDILNNIDLKAFSLTEDGILRYFGTTAEAEEKESL